MISYSPGAGTHTEEMLEVSQFWDSRDFYSVSKYKACRCRPLRVLGFEALVRMSWLVVAPLEPEALLTVFLSALKLCTTKYPKA